MTDSSNGVTRRTFAATLALASALRANETTPPRQQVYWYDRIRRLGQININEKDAATLNIDEWIDYWSSLKVDGLIASAGGIVAFYPTVVPFQHVSPWLGQRDLFGDFLRAARHAKIRVVARLDPTYNFSDALVAHPEWFFRDRSGKPVKHREATQLYATCMFGAYYDQHMVAIIRELNQHYDPDGFYTNGWPGTGLGRICYCDHCRSSYRDRFHSELPESSNRADPNFRRWTDWRLDRVLQVWTLWQNTAVEGRPDRVYVGNLGGSIRAEVNVKKIAGLCKWMNADHQDRSGATPLWDCAQQGRISYSVMRGRTATNVTSAYNMSDAIWRHTSKPPVEMRSWLAQTAASGMALWETWLGGSPKDKRWQQPSRNFFQWLAANQKHYFNRRSLSAVALVWPQRTQTWHPKLAGNTEALQGFYYALLEARIPFDLVHDEDLSPERVAQYAVIALPNAALLSDAACECLRGYSQKGGALVATSETSLYNEWGDLRKNFGLTDVFGATVKGQVEGPLHNSYLQVEGGHPILEGLGDTRLLPGPIFRVPIENIENPILTRVPPFPAFPPEFVFPESSKTIGPSLVIKESKGRTVYFPDDVDRTFWRSWNHDLGMLLANAVRWAGKDPYSAKVSGPGLLDIFYWATEPGLALHILNYTTPALMKGPARAIYPVGPLEVRLRLPDNFHPGKAMVLSNHLEIAQQQHGHELVLTVPVVNEYEVVVVPHAS